MKAFVSLWLFLYACSLLASCTNGDDAGSRNKYINVGLVSNWGATPFHMEASEYVAEESEPLFWKFITSKFEGSTPENLYKKSLEVAETLLMNDKVQLLKLALSLRTYSPEIEMYRQLPKMENDSTAATHARIGTNVFSSASELETAIAKFSPESTSNVPLFEFDHIYPTRHNHTHHVVLYADFADPTFPSFHSVLSSVAEKGQIGYVFRHLVPASSTKMNLQGWGVDLAIKNVEYKAMDDSKVSKDGGEEEGAAISGIDEEEDIAGFRLAVLKQRKPHLAQQLDDFGTFLMRQDVKVEDLNVWDFKDMGLQASQKIITNSDPLRALRDISQNFPSLAGSLTRLKQNHTLKQEFSHNHYRVGEGENVVLLNGRVVDPENLDAFDFQRVLKEEISKVEALQTLKMSLQTILPFVSNPLQEKTNLRFKVDSERIIFVNNLEKDDTYNRWYRGVRDILRGVYPGQMRFIAKNFFTVVLVSDFSTDQGLDAAVTLFSLTNQNLPARVGILPIAKRDEPASEELAKILLYIAEKTGHKHVFRFLYQFNQRVSRPITSEGIKNAYNEIAPNFSFDSYETIMASEEAATYLAEARAALETLGLDSHHMFINGFLADITTKEILDAISEAMYEQTPLFQSLVQQGRITDSTDIYQFLLNPPDYLSRSINVVKRFNKYVPPSDAYPLQYVNLLGTGVGAKTGEWETLSVAEKTSLIISRLSFLEANKDDVKRFSHILVVDASKAQSVQLAVEAMQFVENSKNSRVALLFNPESVPSTATEFSTYFAVEEAIIKAGSNLGVVKALLESQLSALQSNVPLSAEAIAKVIEEARKGKKLQQISTDPREVLEQRRWWAVNVAGIPEGTSAVIVNGRKLPLLDTFKALDFEFLEFYQDIRHGRSIDLLVNEPKFEGVDPDDLTSSFISTVVMQAISQLGLDEQNGIKRRALAADLKVSAEQSTTENSTLQITAVLNPLSKASQKFAPVLLTLRKLLAVRIQLVLNPVLQLSDLPLKRYYHYVFNADVEFDENGQLIPGNTATLSQLPLTRILTLGMDTPEAWLVQPIVARYDLDNIKLEDLGDEKVLTAVFELEYILVEGNCYDLSTLHWGMPTPPRGLELVLQHNDPTVPSVDTLVMSNFGYFQLKANPGIWKLKLAEGRGTMIFSMVKGNEDDQSDFKWVVVSSFLGETVLLQVKRNPGMETTQLLLTEEEESSNAWDALAGLWKGNGKKEESTTPTTLHIFSVASGHLYERLTRIMVLSVLKQTKNPVKFWFLKNYMSPKFKEILPEMAKQYNFTYELVTYKWPSWLRKQTEKQRIIWAYKILFLDVLFPLDVKRVIFVDADQVVRTDMMELYNMDLQGAPLAYTPFCNNKPEMDGFRFWKAGYWKDHLRGKPYHISALYVIDLQQFRRTAAGDHLRSTYDMLSRDPNSLANLDQDLPNYLQHNVKIFSLPQEWLWCETWCPEETKATAKTIDLCNNPLTKASKLENAVRILGDEWISLDNEVKELEQRIYQNKSPSSSSPSPSSSSSHPHSSHTTHEDISVDKIKQAFGQLRQE